MIIFSHIASFFKKYILNATWQQKVSAGIALVAPGLQTLISLTAGEDNAAEIERIVSEVQTDLAVLSGLLAKSKAGDNVSATIVNVLEALKGSLSELLSAGHIKNADTLSKVTAITNGVVAEIEAILPLIPLQ